MSDTNFATLKAKFAFIADAYTSGGGFADGGYLDQYPRESDIKLQRRKDVAWYQNDIKPASERFVAYLFKKPPTRDIQHPLVAQFADDCDWRQNSLDVFLASFCSEAKARGSMLLLVDMPSTEAITLAQQQESRFFPYLVSIAPEHIHSYTLNERGAFDEIGIESTATINGEEKNVIRWWNTTSWWVTDGSITISQGDHNLGTCPVLAFSEGISFPNLGDFGQIANISKRLYNMRSELDEILRSQTFSLLTYQVPPDAQGQINPSQIAEAIGTHNMLMHPAATPAFIAPPEGPAMVYMDAIAKLENSIKEIGMDTTVTVNSRLAESGVALAMRFQTLNASLLSFARKAEDLERRVFDLVARWLKIQNTTTVSWPKDFNISDLEQELLVLKDMQSTNFPEAVVTEKKKQIIRLDFSNLSAEELQPLVDACDESLMTDMPTDSNSESTTDQLAKDGQPNNDSVEGDNL